MPVGLGCDGSAVHRLGSLWLEARNALLLGRLRRGPEAMQARDALEIATRGGAAAWAARARSARWRSGAVGDLAVWPLEGIPFAGALSDPVEAWLRCGPTGARHTVVAGRAIVADGELVDGAVTEILARHRQVALRLQGQATTS